MGIPTLSEVVNPVRQDRVAVCARELSSAVVNFLWADRPLGALQSSAFPVDLADKLF